MTPAIVRPIVSVSHSVRPARPLDARALAVLDASTNANPRTEQQFACACSGIDGAREWTLIVEEDSRVDGFVMVSSVLDEASIHSIAVNPAQQRKGLGLTLLSAALLKMRKTGANRCLLEVRESNAAARRLYERSGFLLDGVRKNYYATESGREHALLLSLNLEGIPNERA
jgi:[ribosomal protein S18]-alanine N-acetyltransferase